jgi:Rap1a immunity proteins
MKWIAALLCYASLLGGLGLSHTKKDDRGVFVSAQELAANCKAMKDTVGEAYALGPVQGPSTKPTGTTDDMIALGRCMGYVEGVADEFRESMGSHYHPLPARRGELPVLIDTFLKRVAEHPEERDLAASTVLHEADDDVLNLCGDCNFGLLVRSH